MGLRRGRTAVDRPLTRTADGCATTRPRARPPTSASACPTSWLSRARSPTPGSPPPTASRSTQGGGTCGPPPSGGSSRTCVAMPKRAWLEYLAGNTEEALTLLGAAAERQRGQGKALGLYYRGAILNRLGRQEEALASLDRALAERPDLVVAREERGESLWRLGRRQEAIAAWSEAVGASPSLVIANNLLAGASAAVGQPEAAAGYERRAGRGHARRSARPLDDRSPAAAHRDGEAVGEALPPRRPARSPVPGPPRLVAVPAETTTARGCRPSRSRPGLPARRASRSPPRPRTADGC